MPKVLMKGNEAIGEAAIRAGCLHYFGYPITPQTEIMEYLAKRLPVVGGMFLQAESEVAASNMVYGAASVGMRVMTSSSSPGISLMAEAISYIAACELPVVIVNMMRSGPGLGGILPAQGDYFQATKGMAHGDFNLIVLAPASVQEAADLTTLAFELAERYHNPVMVIGDGMIGQMMEPVEFAGQGVGKPLDPGDWALTGCEGRPKRVITSLYLDPDACFEHNLKLQAKWERIEEAECRFESYQCEKPYDVLLTAFGMTSRICKAAIQELAEEGISIGLFRPITVHPFPYAACRKAIEKAKRVLDVEMNMGQMLEDVRLACEGARPIDFFGTAGGIVPAPEDVVRRIRECLDKSEGSRKPTTRKPASDKPAPSSRTSDKLASSKLASSRSVSSKSVSRKPTDSRDAPR
jgi:2-oxoglutarate ferredoxin oxidoreductase subunit alpha